MAKSIHVSMPNFTITVSEGGAVVREITDCGFGRQQHPTSIFAGGHLSDQRERLHLSRRYNNAPMPYALFIADQDGIAFHQGDPLVESHGCIHLTEVDARWLYDWAGDDPVAVDIVGPHPLPGARPSVYALGARNMRVATIRRIRAALAARALLPAGEEAIYDEALDAAVRAWQGAQGLEADGKVGPRTAQSLGIAL